MGNDESCCDEVEKKGELQSKVNSMKYSSIIYNAQNLQKKSNLKNTKNVFSNKMPEQQEENTFNHKNSAQIKSSKISNQERVIQNHLTKEQFVSDKQINLHLQQQNPEKASQFYAKEANKGSNFKSESQLKKNPRFELQNISQGGQFKKNSNASYSNSKLRMSTQKQLTIQYSPIVRKVIERQKPFQTQLQSIPKQKLKTRRINGDKDIYKGQHNYYQKPHGYGVLAKQNGNVLIGKFDNGSINGPAYYIFSNGSYYDGNMINNKANDDKGEFHSKDMSYIGGFKDNLFNGEGKEISQNHYFQGHYENHCKKSGTLMWNSPLRNQNNQQKDLQQGEIQLPLVRRFQSPSEYQYVYEGNFDENQLFTGKGKLKEPTGQYNGDFIQGMKHGSGVYQFESKLRYVGDYKNNKKQGYGKLYNCDDTMSYEGFWKDNLPDGKGYSYGARNVPMQMEFIQGISTILAPESK